MSNEKNLRPGEAKALVLAGLSLVARLAASLSIWFPIYLVMIPAGGANLLIGAFGGLDHHRYLHHDYICPLDLIGPLDIIEPDDLIPPHDLIYSLGIIGLLVSAGIGVTILLWRNFHWKEWQRCNVAGRSRSGPAKPQEPETKMADAVSPLGRAPAETSLTSSHDETKLPHSEEPNRKVSGAASTPRESLAETPLTPSLQESERRSDWADAQITSLEHEPSWAYFDREIRSLLGVDSTLDRQAVITEMTNAKNKLTELGNISGVRLPGNTPLSNYIQNIIEGRGAKGMSATWPHSASVESDYSRRIMRIVTSELGNVEQWMPELEKNLPIFLRSMRQQRPQSTVASIPGSLEPSYSERAVPQIPDFVRRFRRAVREHEAEWRAARERQPNGEFERIIGLSALAKNVCSWIEGDQWAEGIMTPQSLVKTLLNQGMDKLIRASEILNSYFHDNKEYYFINDTRRSLMSFVESESMGIPAKILLEQNTGYFNEAKYPSPEFNESTTVSKKIDALKKKGDFRGQRLIIDVHQVCLVDEMGNLLRDGSVNTDLF